MGSFSIVNAHECIEQALYYHDEITSDAAAKLLEKDGDFLVRKALRDTLQRQMELILSLKWKGQVYHKVIGVDYRGHFSLGYYGFRRVQDLVRYHWERRDSTDGSIAVGCDSATEASSASLVRPIVGQKFLAAKENIRPAFDPHSAQSLDDAGGKVRLFMCPPTYFKLAYSINPWMTREKEVDSAVAETQWKALKTTLEGCGAEIRIMNTKGAEMLPDLVFTANAGVVRNGKIYLASFLYPERKGERILFERWFKDAGYRTCGDIFLPHEGAGDALWADEERLICGTGFRSDLKAVKKLAKEFASDGKPVRITHALLVDPRFYHLDTCLCPLSEKLAVCFPKAFDMETLDRLRGEVELIEVCEEDALKFACNMIVVGKHAVLPKGTDDTCRKLEQRGFTTHQVDVSEFLKAGGACKCLTLRI